MIPFLLWWLIMLVLGWLALPLATRLFRWLPDRGYTGAKALGLLISSYLLWLGASTGFLKNDLGGILFAILVLAAISTWIWRCARSDQPEDSLLEFLKRNRLLVLVSESLFLLAFVLWVVLRAYAPDKIMSAGGEKFMEIAFLNGILNSASFPPLDPWLSGFAIAYYYFGYVMMALMTRLSGVPSGVGFDLYDALLFALTVLGAFGVVYNLIKTARRAGGKPVVRLTDNQPILYGLLGSVFVAILGNLEGLLEVLRARGALPQAFFEWIGVPDLINAPVTGSWYPGTTNMWWWWRGSRVIQDVDLSGNPLGVSPITEFPFFSFLLGDNHPHVLGLPFVLLATALAFNLLLSQLKKGRSEQPEPPNAAAWWNPIRASLDGEAVNFFFTALVLGGLAFLNTWDFPIYLGLNLIAFAAGQAIRFRRLDRPILMRTVVLGAGWLVCAILFYIFFYVGFDSQAGGILPYIFRPTRLVQYLVMFGIFFFILIAFLIIVLVESARQGLPIWRMFRRTWGWVFVTGAGLYAVIIIILAIGSWLSQSNTQLQNLEASLGGITLDRAMRIVALERLQNPWLFLAITVMVGLTLTAIQAYLLGQNGEAATSPDCSEDDPALPFVLLLVLAGILLSWSVEFIYLRDSFMVRMNTVFKFYYQAWIMLACASVYALWWLFDRLSGRLVLRTLVAAGVLVLILAGMVYPVMAYHTRVAGFSYEPNLDGASGIARSNPDDWAAVQWLQAAARNADHIPVILEAPGRSYSYEGRISAFSGLPAVLGWAIHESQWRGNYDEQGLREIDIAAIYTTNDSRYALELLNKWDVDYVILGQTEENYIIQLCMDASRRCNPASAMRKFDLGLLPVFSQESVKIYAVPGK